MDADGTGIPSGQRRRSRWRFSLGTLLGLMTTVCLVSAWFALHRTEYTITIRCDQLPPNDAALIAWMQRQEGVVDVHVSREEGGVAVRYSRRELLPSFAYISPPLGDLGYQSQQVGIAWTAVARSPLIRAFQAARTRTGSMATAVLVCVAGGLVYAWWRLSHPSCKVRRQTD